ncbi:hypothetical protein I553_3774 [Mycobacterium xenopi 4042]|uniref:Uncharacterized protein n=1 Tax=Mycobacterium xenopi 4042 TaxID=1299334 RepID=X8BBJ3_MYCXE|nr:hypothetical protein I553_3774 [Mycobacterium xenopi 4042]
MLLHVARDRAAVADLPRSPCYAKATAASRCRHGMAGETRAHRRRRRFAPPAGLRMST